MAVPAVAEILGELPEMVAAALDYPIRFHRYRRVVLHLVEQLRGGLERRLRPLHGTR